MPRGWLIVLVLAVAAPQSRAQEPVSLPQLVLDAGGHTAAVNKVRFVDAERLVSVANDKTVRVWSVRSGEPLEVLRTPIGSGPAGMLNAADVSRDGRWLAVGGYGLSADRHGVYLIDLARRETTARLRGHTNVILDLAFSADGRLLASASADKTVRLWDLRSFQNQATLRGHRDSVYAVAWAPDSQRLATASLDTTARVWSVRGITELATLQGRAAVQAIAWSADGKQLATGCVDQSIDLWSSDFRRLRRFEKLGNHVTAVRFLPHARSLFLTLGGEGVRDGGVVLNLDNDQRGPVFAGHDNSVLDGALSPDGVLAATADANGEICVWKLGDGRLLHRLRSRGQRPWSAAWDLQSAAIGWGTTSDYREPNDRGPVEFAFQPRGLEFVAPGVDLLRARTRVGATVLAQMDPQKLIVTRGGGRPTELTLAAAQDSPRCFLLLDEQTAAVGSDFGLFLIDTATGRSIRPLQGHAGAVWALALSPDERWLLSAGDDQTLRIWNWRDGQLLVSYFFAGRQWIAWTPAGYYAASPGGERLMGWQLDQGPDRLGRFFPAAQFRRSLYQPELIGQLLDVGSVERALAELRADRERRVLPVAATVAEVLPPEVEITEPSASPSAVTESPLQVRAVARARGQHPVTAMRLLLDGRPYEGNKGVQVVPRALEPAQDITRTWTVGLTPGPHTLAVQAETEVSHGISKLLEVTFEPPGSPSESRLPDLYVLAIGIAEYPPPLRLQFAAGDAQRVVDTLQQVSGRLFRQIHVRLLKNEQATRRDVLGGLTWLRREMTQQDVAVFFFSGHGAKDEAGSFYLVSVDGEPADLAATAVPGSQFKDALAAIPGRVLVLLDACHAGAAGGDRRKAVEVVTDDLIRDLVTDDYGVIVMCSSMGREYSMESDEHQQGYFTVALVEALTGKADYNQDGLVYLTEVDTYLADRVKALTRGQQHPVTTRPATIRSFPLSRPQGP